MNRALALAIAAAVALPVAARAQEYGDESGASYDDNSYDAPRRGPSIDEFRNDSDLSWSGEWIDTPEYGTVWRPTQVDSDWRPYRDGRWEYTTAGWLWVSSEPFGWAVYHYGRWAWTDAGWIWVPGSVWAPAWVSWRWGDGYAGWCALGPRGVVYEQPAVWVFVPARHVLDPVPQHAVPIATAPAVWSRAVALPIRSGPRAGPVAGAVAQETGRNLRPVPVADAPSPHAISSSGGQIAVYRPHAIQPRPGDVRPRASGGGYVESQRGTGDTRPRASGAGSVDPQRGYGDTRPHASSGRGSTSDWPRGSDDNRPHASAGRPSSAPPGTGYGAQPAARGGSAGAAQSAPIHVHAAPAQSAPRARPAGDPHARE